MRVHTRSGSVSATGEWTDGVRDLPGIEAGRVDHLTFAPPEQSGALAEPTGVAARAGTHMLYYGTHDVPWFGSVSCIPASGHCTKAERLRLPSRSGWKRPSMAHIPLTLRAHGPHAAHE